MIASDRSSTSGLIPTVRLLNPLGVAAVAVHRSWADRAQAGTSVGIRESSSQSLALALDYLGEGVQGESLREHPSALRIQPERDQRVLRRPASRLGEPDRRGRLHPGRVCLRLSRESPQICHVLSESDPSAIERGERPHLLASSHVCSEVGGIALPVEGSCSVPAALPPPDLPSNRAVAECSLLDLHGVYGSLNAVRRECSGRTDCLRRGRRRGPASVSSTLLVSHVSIASRLSRGERPIPPSHSQLARADRTPHSLDVDSDELGRVCGGVQPATTL